jgi:MoaA/NifB/PqqE/SkfB family radical SAM enzyme
MSKEIKLFNTVLYDALKKNKGLLLKRPSYIKAFSTISTFQKKQAKQRELLSKKESIVVPPILILSITNDCNLSCAGCYAFHQQREKEEELDIIEINRIVDESVSLGVSVIMIAGGEPLIKEGLLDIPEKHKNTVFVLFTNGLLLSDEKINRLKDIKNLIPILSLEGGKADTDKRRGKGIYDSVLNIMDKMDKKKLLFGTSITLTADNYEDVVNSDYLKNLEDSGCRAAFLIEYVPMQDDDHLCLSEDQKKHIREQSDFNELSMLVVPLPGDEERYGGCLAAGRGFLHISSTGSLEACPFAPYSDLNVKKMPLKQALKSKLLAEIRDKHHLLKESKGGCALNENKEWIAELMR